MVEGDSDTEDAAVFRIAQQTARMLEARRKRDNARRMAKMMRNFRQEQLHNQRHDDPVETQVEVELDDAESLRLRMLREAEEESAGRSSPKAEESEPPEPPAKYEAPLVAQLRTLETVEELYQLADVIVPLKTS